MTIGSTPLNTFGRSRRDEPFFGFLPIRLYPERGTILASEMKEYFGQRYLENSKRGGRAYYRVYVYKHNDGNEYVDRIFLKAMSDDDRVEMVMRFGTDFSEQKMVRDGRSIRPKLKPAERKKLDQMTAQFYAEILAARKTRMGEM